MALSDQVDQEYENEVEMQRRERREQKEAKEAELAFIEDVWALFEQTCSTSTDNERDGEFSVAPADLNVSFTRLGCT